MEKTQKDYEKEEDRRKDLKVLYVLIPIILVVIFVLWLFRDCEKSVEKSYEGVLINADGSYEQNITATISGTITYDSMFSDDIVGFGLDIVLKNNSGNIVLDVYSELNNIEGVDFSFSSGIAPIFGFIEEKDTFGWLGQLTGGDNLENIVLKLDDGRCFAAPAKTLEEACLLAGCSNDNAPQEEKLKPVLSLSSEEYDVSGKLWRKKSDGTFYYVDGAKLCEVQLNDFAASFEDENGTNELSFKWCEVDGVIYTYTDDAMPVDFGVKNIDGNTEAVVLEKTIRQEGIKIAGLCNLKENKVELLFGGALSEYVTVDGIDVSKDLNTAIFTIEEPYSTVFYDGKELINLAEICNKTDADRIGAHFSDNDILIFSTDFKDDDVRKPEVSAYVYNPENKTAQKVLEETKAYSEGEQPDGLVIGSKYGYYYKDKMLCFVDILNDKDTATEISIDDVYSVKQVGDALFGVVLKDGSTALVEASTGKTVYKSQKTTGYTSGLELYCSDGVLYAGICVEGEYLIFN